MVKFELQTSYGQPNWYPCSVTFYAPLVFAANGSPDPQRQGVYTANWAAQSYGHNGDYDAKAIVHWVKQGYPPQSNDEILWQGFEVDNLIVRVDITTQVSPDPYVFAYDPANPDLDSPQIAWQILGSFAPETQNLLTHTIQICSSGGSVVWEESGYSPATIGTVFWDGKTSAGQPCPAGLYSVMMSASRVGLQDGHSLRQCDVTVATVPGKPLAVRYQKFAVGTVKFQFNYSLTDPTGNGADSVTATLYGPNLQPVGQDVALVGVPGTYELYGTFCGIDFTEGGTYTVLITYKEKTTEHSRWNKDHEADFGMPLAATFHVPYAVACSGSGVAQEEGLVQQYMGGLDGPTWYATKVVPDSQNAPKDTPRLRATVNAHRPAIVYVGAHGEGAHHATLMIKAAEWILVPYDAADPVADRPMHSSEPRPVASASHPDYCWDLSQCTVAVFAACYSGLPDTHGVFRDASVSRGAQAGVDFTDMLNGGTDWCNFFFGHLCVGPKLFGCSPDGPQPLCVALNEARWHYYQAFGEYGGYDTYMIAGNAGAMVVPAP